MPQREKKPWQQGSIATWKVFAIRKVFLYIPDFFWTKSGIFLDTMENSHVFWKSYQTISSSGQVSNNNQEKIFLIWNISRQQGKVSFILEKFSDNICYRTSFQQDSGQNLFNLEHFQIVWKSFTYSGKVSGHYMFPVKFPTKFWIKFFKKNTFLDKIWIICKQYGKCSFSLIKFQDKISLRINYLTSFRTEFRKNLFPDKIWNIPG